MGGADDHHGNSGEHWESAKDVNMTRVCDPDDRQGQRTATHETVRSMKVRRGLNGEAALPELHVQPGIRGVDNV
jgi:hypothetical protein